MRTQKTKTTSGLIVLPDAKTIRRKLLATVRTDEVFVEGRLCAPLGKYSGDGMSPQDFVRRFLVTINLVTQETPKESDLEMIMFSRMSRYIDALVPADVREAVHERFERIRERAHN